MHPPTGAVLAPAFVALAVLAADGRGQFSIAPPVSVHVATTAPSGDGLPAAALSADLDDDGHLDVLILDRSGSAPRLTSLLGDGTGGFAVVLQAWIPDAEGPVGFASSNGLRGDVP